MSSTRVELAAELSRAYDLIAKHADADSSAAEIKELLRCSGVCDEVIGIALADIRPE
jgi:hypothetical protein